MLYHLHIISFFSCFYHPPASHATNNAVYSLSVIRGYVTLLISPFSFIMAATSSKSSVKSSSGTGRKTVINFIDRLPSVLTINHLLPYIDATDSFASSCVSRQWLIVFGFDLNNKWRNWINLARIQRWMANR
jgi:hypothetical protein